MPAGSQQTRRGAARRAAVVPVVPMMAAIVIGALVGCFRADVLAYAPCEASDSCAEAGLFGCLRLPDDASVRGSCTEACELDEACPPPPGGDATPRCAEVDGARLCVLSCMDEETCPEGQVCTEAAEVDGGVAWLCFPEAS